MDGTTPPGIPQDGTDTESPAARTAADGTAAEHTDSAHTDSATPAWVAPEASGRHGEVALRIRGLRKRFGDKEAVKDIDLDVPAGSFFGLVGPNGAGKTTTLSMATALLRPDSGVVTIHEVDVWKDTLEAKRLIGVLADGVKLFDRLTGLQLVTYYGLLCGLERSVVVERTDDLLALLGLDPADRTLVVDYSAGMTKKIALACALVRAPRLLVLDEPFESVDPVSAANIRDILTGFVASGGTVIVSSHSMDLVERMCDRVAVIADGRVLASGTLEEVRAGSSLEERFVELVGGRTHQEGPAWLRIS
ncbi:MULTISPECIES: ABC transporter ATP-binding protein [unclassified Rathayibacter]|uniref:ABC transporter ATP-binding protein n=1 Tax=unclassified Rathayibacter TaxID=2609250 RepID=UPI000CE8DB26|nr:MULTISPECIES: ABC transporter ATP-binding protein [unclassified Rathayibacter]PPI41660.1 ABC transporter [Rathayibacter sp. RFBD1]PPI63161.1 ABC transporter [Rathayibacter sp. TRS19]